MSATTLSPDELAAAMADNMNLPVSNRPQTIIGVTITFLFIALSAVALRMFVRWRNALWDWDDLFVIFAACAVTVGSVITCLMPSDGLGKHYFTLTEAQHMEYFRHIWASNITYAFSGACIKVAILIQYLRLFDNQILLARRLCFGLLTLVSVWGITFTLLAIFPCSPIEKNWKVTLPGHCVGWGSKQPDSLFEMFVGHSASNTVLDLCVLALPMPFMKQLRMSGKSRIALAVLFSMGGIVVTLAAARVVSLCIKRAGTVPVFDPTYATPTVYIFSVLEVNVAIMCASIPIFWPLVTQLASNKILIVNEIEVRSERRSEHIDLVAHGKEDSYMNIGEVVDGRGSRASISGKFSNGKTSTESNMPTRLVRSMSRTTTSHSGHHRHNKNSSSSSKDALGIQLSVRASNDSDRNHTLLHSTSTHSFNSSKQNVGVSLEGVGNDHTHARYKDGYHQGWAVPDFDKVDSPLPLYQTSAQRAQVPFDHIGTGVEGIKK